MVTDEAVPEERVVEGPVEGDDQRGPRPGRRDREVPFVGVDRAPDVRADGVATRRAGCEGMAVAVAEAGVDRHVDRDALGQRVPDRLVRREAPLDARRIEQDRDPPAFAVPELGLHREEGGVDRFAGVAAPDVDAPGDLAFAHGGGELDVQLQLVARERRRGGEDLDDPGRRAGRGARYGHGERDVVVELERLRLTRVARTVDERVDEGVVHEHAVVGAGKEGEPGHEAQGVAVGRVVPGDRWHRSGMTKGAASTGSHALDDLGGRDDHASLDGHRVGRDQRGRGAGGQPGHPEAAGAVQRRELGVQGPRYSDAALSERRWRAPDSSCCSANT